MSIYFRSTFIFFGILFSIQVFSKNLKEINIKNDFFSSKGTKEKLLVFKSISPLYKKEAKYEGYYLNDLFKEKGIDITKIEMINFIAKDDFRIAIPSSFILKYNPFLAIRDTSLSKGKNWRIVRDGGRKIDGGPYYLMWESGNKRIPENYWAFGVVRIQFSTFKEIYGSIVPDDPKEQLPMQGFQVFQTSCTGCHSVNLVGGSLGLEMNVPKNFVEYLQKDFILEYTKSPQSFRVNAKMPPQGGFLTDEEIKSLIEYLEYMKQKKICSTEKECIKMQDKLN